MNLRLSNPRARLVSATVLLLAAVGLSLARTTDDSSEPAPTSKLAAINLPAGAQRILDKEAVGHTTAALDALAAGLDTPTKVQRTEVLAWGGEETFTADKARKVMAKVESTLTTAGFQTSNVGEPTKEGGRTISFFVAGSAAKKKAYVGYWMEGENLLMLVWGEFAQPGAGAAAPGAPAAAPGTPKFPKLTAKPNQATGMVTDMRGNPLASARIRFWRVTPQGAIIEYVARTNGEGIYSIDLPASPDYRIDNATALVAYGVQRYYLPLRPAGGDGTFFDGDAIDVSKGYVKNFVLPISGLISPEEDPKEELSYYGGAIRFRAPIRIEVPGDPAMTQGANPPNALPEGTQIQLTLTPQGALLDGTAGRPLSWTMKITNNTGRNAYAATLKDIPLGVYTATARITTPDGKSYASTLAARIVTAKGISNTFTTDAENPIFFAPRWEDWPMVNGNLRATPQIKRSSKSGAGSVWLEPGS